MGRGSDQPREVVHFEAFLEDPGREIDRIARLCGLSREGLRLDGRTVHLSPNHLVAGNGDRFNTGVIEIEPRDVAGLDRPLDHLLSSIASFPMTLRFRYRVLRRRKPKPPG